MQNVPALATTRLPREMAPNATRAATRGAQPAPTLACFGQICIVYSRFQRCSGGTHARFQTTLAALSGWDDRVARAEAGGVTLLLSRDEVECLHRI